MPSRDIDKLHPVVARKCRALLTKIVERGLNAKVTNTLRVQEEQTALYAQGRQPLQEVNQLRAMAHMPPIKAERNRIVTKVRTSVHQFGLGFDIVLTDGLGDIHWDTKVDINEGGGADYLEIGPIGEDLGLLWGGRFKNRDYVHFEWTGGLTLAELRAGKRPPEDGKKTDEPQKQEDAMNPAIAILLTEVVRGAVGKDTKENYEKKTGKKRPKLLSRRAIGLAITAVSGLLATCLGIDLPQAELNNLADYVPAAVDLFEQNWAFFGTVWGTVITLVGYFKRDKKGKKR